MPRTPPTTGSATSGTNIFGPAGLRSCVRRPPRAIRRERGCRPGWRRQVPDPAVFAPFLQASADFSRRGEPLSGFASSASTSPIGRHRPVGQLDRPVVHAARAGGDKRFDHGLDGRSHPQGGTASPPERRSCGAPTSTVGRRRRGRQPDHSHPELARSSRSASWSPTSATNSMWVYSLSADGIDFDSLPIHTSCNNDHDVEVPTGLSVRCGAAVLGCHARS